MGGELEMKVGKSAEKGGEMDGKVWAVSKWWVNSRYIGGKMGSK